MESGNRGRPLFATVLGMAALMPRAAATGAGPAAEPPPPVVFEGFGLGDFAGAGSIASALRASDVAAAAPAALPLDVVVRGPTGRDAVLNPLAAEIRSRIDGLDVSAGVQADQLVPRNGPSRWVGALGVANDHHLGRDILELRTSLGHDRQSSVLLLEMGPRFERRLPGGISVFLDGKAQAQSLRSPDTGEWAGPGSLSGDMGMIGVSARTGFTR